MFALPGTRFGPELDAHFRFHTAGVYQLWAQFRLANGHVITVPFTVRGELSETGPARRGIPPAPAARPDVSPHRSIGEPMSPPIPSTLHRIAAVAGGGSAAILLINAAKRAEVIPTSAFTQLVAPLAQILALALITGLYLAVGRRAGTFGLIAYLLNAFALAALVGVEFVINLVFADLPDRTIEALRDGTLGVALTVASISFLLGTLAYVAAMLSTREVPTPPLVLYALGAVPVSLRALVPEAALNLGLVTMAVGAGWLAIWLFNRSSRITTRAGQVVSDVPLVGASH